MYICTTVFFRLTPSTYSFKVYVVYLHLTQPRTHTHTYIHSAGLPWTSNQPVVETSTWLHTTFTRDKHPCSRRDSNLQPQHASGHRSTPYTAQLSGSTGHVYYGEIYFMWRLRAWFPAGVFWYLYHTVYMFILTPLLHSKSSSGVYLRSIKYGQSYGICMIQSRCRSKRSVLDRYFRILTALLSIWKEFSHGFLSVCTDEYCYGTCRQATSSFPALSSVIHYNLRAICSWK
jgi:hypothetical protein